MQHLFGILAGDLLDLRVAAFDIKELAVQEVVFPESWRTVTRGAFRGTRAHTIDEIRSLFGLKVGEPLLAFSVKPRVGLSLRWICAASNNSLAEVSPPHPN